MSECGSSSCACKPAAEKPAKSSEIKNGKGDAPRNISQKFRSNFDAINWGSKPSKKR